MKQTILRLDLGQWRSFGW